MQKKTYQKPKVTIKRVKMNFFMTGTRFFDSFDELLAPSAFAQTGGGCGSGSGSGSNMFEP